MSLVLLKRFISNWKPHLESFAPRGMSYYLPTHLGGLGLPIIGTYEKRMPDGSKRGRFSRQQLVVANYLASSPERQSCLNSMNNITVSESFSLWKKISEQAKSIEEQVGYTWTKQQLVERADNTYTSRLLAAAYTQLIPSDLNQEVRETELESRYRDWKKCYERMWKHAEHSTFRPMEESKVLSDRPWNKVLNDFIISDPNNRIDLRVARGVVLVESPEVKRACTTFESERFVDHYGHLTNLTD